MTVTYMPPSLEHRRWGSERAERAFEAACRRQGIPLLTHGEILALYEPESDEAEAEFDRIMFERIAEP